MWRLWEIVFSTGPLGSSQTNTFMRKASHMWRLWENVYSTGLLSTSQTNTLRRKASHMWRLWENVYSTGLLSTSQTDTFRRKASHMWRLWEIVFCTVKFSLAQRNTFWWKTSQMWRLWKIVRSTTIFTFTQTDTLLEYAIQMQTAEMRFIALFLLQSAAVNRLSCDVCCRYVWFWAINEFPDISAAKTNLSTMDLIFSLNRAPLGYFYNAPHWGGGLFRAPPLWSPKLPDRF